MSHCFSCWNSSLQIRLEEPIPLAEIPRTPRASLAFSRWSFFGRDILGRLETFLTLQIGIVQLPVIHVNLNSVRRLPDGCVPSERKCLIS